MIRIRRIRCPRKVLELGNPLLNIKDAEREQIRIRLRQAKVPRIGIACGLGRDNRNQNHLLDFVNRNANGVLVHHAASPASLPAQSARDPEGLA